jgi:putative ABC transport system ATP-binding protein
MVAAACACPVPSHSTRKSRYSTTPMLIEIRNLTRQFRKGGETITPLDDVTLDIDRGEFVSLMGPSGTGKSTLLNQIAGIDRPDSGTIIVAGTEITRLSRSRLAGWRAENVGYIFQTHNLIPVLTAYENVEQPLLLLPFNREERRRRVLIALEAVDLVDRASHYPRQLSGGQEQRVGIARAIVADPTVVVADEPTGDLDSVTSGQILDLLQRLNQDLGTTLLMVTHDEQAAGIASRQLRLNNGRIVELERCLESTDSSTDQK